VLTKLYHLVHTELTPEISWIGGHKEHLRSKFAALHHDTFHSVDVLSEVIAPEVITHLIASDPGIQYNEALDILKDETALNYAWADGRRKRLILERRRICTYSY